MTAPLLERWRAEPHRLLAEVIDLRETELRRFPSQAKAVLWAREAVLDPVDEDLPTILDVAYRSRSTAVSTRLTQALLVHWPDDPRLTTAFRHWLHNPPWTGAGSRTVWGRVLKLLMRTADSRALELAKLDPHALFGGSTADWLVPKLRKLGARSLPRETASVEDLHAWQDEIDQHRRRVARRETLRSSVEQMFDAVFADPSVLSKRHILADALLELDDPRGEFIQLQLAAKTPGVARQERALLKAHGSSWAGDLDRVFLKGGRVWRNGFLVAGRLKVKNDTDEVRATKDRAWRLVERVELCHSIVTRAEAPAPLFQAAGLLHTVTGIQFAFELQSVLQSPAPLRRLELASPGMDVPSWFRPLRASDIRRIPHLVLAGAWLGEIECLADVMRVDVVELPLGELDAQADPVAAVTALLPRLHRFATQVVVAAKSDAAEALKQAGIAVVVDH